MKIKKMPRDLNLLANKIVGIATDERIEKKEKKNPHVEAGRLGGLKGGKARAKILTPEERSEIAKKAVMARWNK